VDDSKSQRISDFKTIGEKLIYIDFLPIFDFFGIITFPDPDHLIKCSNSGLDGIYDLIDFALGQKIDGPSVVEAGITAV